MNRGGPRSPSWGFPSHQAKDRAPGPKRRQRGANERETGNTTFLMKVFTPFTPLWGTLHTKINFLRLKKVNNVFNKRAQTT
jgi:hypothetical protein